MLEVEKINVFYNGVQALWDVSITVNQGEIVTIIGPNGAGKTTILNTIMGLLRTKSGYIKFLGKRIDTLTPYEIVELGITMVPEGRGLFPFMTVQENLELGAYTSRARKLLRVTLEQVYKVFPILYERRHQLAGTLSGGEQQMLAIGRALMSRPNLLLLDEPSLGLAPIVVEKTFDVLKRFHEKEGLTILLVEQNVAKGLELANRAYVLENGRIVLEGSSTNLRGNGYVKKSYLGL